jgi:8-oxo-dGTP diphosphatase
MRPAYGAKESGIGEQQLTIVVDVANVMGSRPDGWWRDRAGAAVRLYTELAQLAESGRAIPPGETMKPGFVMVLEGAAKAAATRVDTATSGQVEIVQARGSGDDAIVDLVRELPGRRAVVTADRELQNRCAAAGATILRPGWLLSQLREEGT